MRGLVIGEVSGGDAGIDLWRSVTQPWEVSKKDLGSLVPP